MRVQCVLALAMSPGAHRRWSLPRGETSLFPGLPMLAHQPSWGSLISVKILVEPGLFGVFHSPYTGFENKE